MPEGVHRDGLRLGMHRHADEGARRVGADDARLHAAAALRRLRTHLCAGAGAVRGGGDGAADHGHLGGGDGQPAVPVHVLRVHLHAGHVCANGFVEFVGPATTNCSATNAAIPTGAAERPDRGVLGRPGDRRRGVDPGDVRGSAPNRRFVIEFRNAHFSSDTTRRVDFNVVLFENGRS